MPFDPLCPLHRLFAPIVLFNLHTGTESNCKDFELYSKWISRLLVVFIGRVRTIELVFIAKNDDLIGGLEFVSLPLGLFQHRPDFAVWRLADDCAGLDSGARPRLTCPCLGGFFLDGPPHTDCRVDDPLHVDLHLGRPPHADPPPPRPCL